MISSEIKQRIASLQLAEKILLVEDIWDSIAQSNAELPLPEWQKKELSQRDQEYRQDKLELHDWQEVHKALRKKHS